LKSLLSIILILAGLPLYALDKGGSTTLLGGGIIGISDRIGHRDSLLPVRNSYQGKEELISRFRNEELAARNEDFTSRNEQLVSDLLDAETDYRAIGNNRRTLVRLLKILRVKKAGWDARSGARLFSDLAGVSVKLKLYSLAMKCYYKAEQYKSRTQLTWYRSIRLTGSDTADAGTNHDFGDAGASRDFAEVDADNVNPLPDSSSYAQLLNRTTPAQLSDPPPYTAKSEPVKTSDIWESFDDGKTAVSYALIVHAKQPISGKRKSFTHINNVGHMFITLIKYNDDNTVVTRSFGFYPHKTNILSATPLLARSASVFKDDALHEWDEIAGKFISGRRFQKIIELLKRYDHLTYNLNRNNCTDFGLNVAELGGISISQTRGTWPLGKGNNPANAGQSMLEGKIKNIDPDYHEPLFICSNVLPY